MTDFLQALDSATLIKWAAFVVKSVVDLLSAREGRDPAAIEADIRAELEAIDSAEAAARAREDALADS